MTGVNRQKIINFLTVIVFSVVVIFLSVHYKLEREKHHFNSLAQKYIEAVKQELDDNSRVISMIKFGVKQNRDLSRRDFRLLSRVHLIYKKSISTIGWIPKVFARDKLNLEESAKADGFPFFRIFPGEASEFAADNSLYFPVYFIEPYVKNESFMGFNLASEAFFRSLITESSKTGKIMAAPWGDSGSNQDVLEEFLLIAPVYARKLSGYQPPALERLRGFIVTFHNFGHIIQGIAAGFSDHRDIEVQILKDNKNQSFGPDISENGMNINFSSYSDLVRIGGLDLRIFVKLGPEYWIKIKWVVTVLNIVLVILVILTVGFLIHYLLTDSERTRLLVDERTANYKKAKHLAEKALASRSRFLANMSHEIRTPLNSILGFAELLHEDEQNSDKKRVLSTIKNSGEGLLCIINDILDLSRLEAGQFKFTNSWVEIREFMRQITDMFQVEAGKKNLRLECEVEEGVRNFFYLDRDRLRQILINLTGNSVKFTGSGFVRLTAGVANNHLVFKIEDTGIGMTKEQASRVFTAFTQGEDSTTKRFGGTGLGLTIVQTLVSHWGGTIEVESEYGKGSLFTLSLPVSADVQRNYIDRGQEGGAGTSSVTGEPVKVLVCEDNMVNIDLIKVRLKKMNATVTVAKNGQEGFDAFTRGSFDLVLMDIQMPVMDGVEATVKIREFEHSKGRAPTPVVALTANVLNEDIEKYLEAGMDAHLAKPLRKKSLEEVMNKYCYSRKELKMSASESV